MVVVENVTLCIKYYAYFVSSNFTLANRTEGTMVDFRAANNPSKYPGNSIVKHYDIFNKGQTAELKFFILDVQNDIVKRQISEALFIKNEKSGINSRDEMVEALKFLAKFDEN